MSKAGSKRVEEVGAQVVVEQVAAIAAKSFANLGDNEQISSEDGLKMIVRVLKRYDSTILDRNLKRQLPK